jgi:hypothetical protein
MLWSAIYRKHFPPPRSPSRSAAATRASRRSKNWDRLRAVIDQHRLPGLRRCAGPGGSTGLLIRDDKGEDADRLVYGVDTASSLHCALARRFGPLYDKPTYPGAIAGALQEPRLRLGRAPS